MLAPQPKRPNKRAENDEGAETDPEGEEVGADPHKEAWGTEPE